LGKRTDERVYSLDGLFLNRPKKMKRHMNVGGFHPTNGGKLAPPFLNEGRHLSPKELGQRKCEKDPHFFCVYRSHCHKCSSNFLAERDWI